MRPINNPVVIFSVETKDLTNAERSNLNIAAINYLNHLNIPYIKLKGCYKGVTEDSYIVHMDHFAAVYRLAEMTDQESVLIKHEDGNACLFYIHKPWDKGPKPSTHIGSFHAVSEAEAKTEDAWSYRPDLNQYYIVK